jgi:hypothetical protein
MGIFDIFGLLNAQQGPAPNGATPPYVPGQAQPPAPPSAPPPQASQPMPPPQSFLGQAAQSRGALKDLGVGPTDYAMANQAKQPKEGKWYDTFKDKNNWSMALSAGAAAMGSPGLKQIANANYAHGLKTKQNNKTLELLRTQNPELYKIAKDLPPEYLGEFMQQHIKRKAGGPEFRTNTSGVQIDEATGRRFVVESDGYGNPPTIRFLKDDEGNYLTGQTGQDEADIEIRTNGITLAADKGSQFFDQGESLRADIRLMEEAKSALADGARTGIAQQYLPAFDEATQRLRTAANKAGINIINSATFGALSEKEMALALSTGIPHGLNEAELNEYLTDRIAAQEKLYGEITQRAIDLNSGSKTLGEWQEVWREQEKGYEYNDDYASRWSDIKYDKHGKKIEDDDDDDDDIIDVTTPTATVKRTGPRRRRY